MSKVNDVFRVVQQEFEEHSNFINGRRKDVVRHKEYLENIYVGLACMEMEMKERVENIEHSRVNLFFGRWEGVEYNEKAQ